MLILLGSRPLKKVIVRKSLDAGSFARLDRYLGYYESYADSHEALDRNLDFQEEVRNVARAVMKAVEELRAGRLSQPDRALRAPRPK